MENEILSVRIKIRDLSQYGFALFQVFLGLIKIRIPPPVCTFRLIPDWWDSWSGISDCQARSIPSCSCAAWLDWWCWRCCCISQEVYKQRRQRLRMAWLAEVSERSSWWRLSHRCCSVKLKMFRRVTPASVSLPSAMKESRLVTARWISIRRMFQHPLTN